VKRGGVGGKSFITHSHPPLSKDPYYLTVDSHQCRYRDDGDDRSMEVASFKDLQAEEKRSARLGKGAEEVASTCLSILIQLTLANAPTQCSHTFPYSAGRMEDEREEMLERKHQEEKAKKKKHKAKKQSKFLND
jgi:hypothetical protein